MDVTEGNFIEALALVQNSLPTASFVSIDLEFTGLGDTRPSQLDTPAVRYETARADAEKFPPIQFGLSIFQRTLPASHPAPAFNSPEAPSAPPSPEESVAVTSHVEAANTDTHFLWHVIPFNFNIFPRAEYSPPTARYPHIDRIFSLQSSTVKFLLDHGIDFMKIFTRGVSWLREEHEQPLRKHVLKTLRNRRNPLSKKAQMSENDKKQFKKWCDMFDEWRSGLTAEAQTNSAQPPFCVLPYPRVSNRRVLFDYLREKHPRVVSSPIETQEGMRLKLVLHPSMTAADEQREAALVEEAEESVSRAVGFRLIIDALRQAGVPIVVHHGLMDMVKMYANFVSPLPDSLQEFKANFGRTFPTVYDTRWMIEHLCQLRVEVRKAIDADKARSMDEIVPSLRAFVLKSGKGRLPDIRTFIPTGKINRNGKTLGKGYVMEKDKGFEVLENADDFDVESDLYRFGRYAHVGGGSFEHEAGFDAMGAGKLFVLLLSIADVVAEKDLKHALIRVQNKIFLGSCGGYQYIDIDKQGEDEDNIYLNEGKAVVVSESPKHEECENGKGNPHRRFRDLLKRLAEGSDFDGDKSTFLLAGPTCMLALFEKKSGPVAVGEKRDRDTVADLERIVENGKKIGVHVERYEVAVRSADSILKRRRCV